MSTQQDNEKIIWVRGNTQQLLIPLEKEVVSPSGDITTVDFYPDEEAVIKVILYNDYRKYEYTPSLDGNLLTITDSGTLAVGCYGVAVTVKNPDGTRLHSNWNHQVVVTATNNSVLKEWDEFKEQDVKARAAVFFFAKGDKGDPLTYEDLTDAQIEELQKPARDAAAKVADFEEQIEEAERARTSAESSRAQSEQARESNEAQRIANETERIVAEQARVLNESRRAETEAVREQQEQSRLLNESQRIQSEQNRVSAEASRVATEQGRVSAEQGRAQSESTRQDNEATRQNQEQTRQQNESSRTTTFNADHLQAGADHATAAADHTLAASDHQTAAADHTLAGTDHQTAAADHTQAGNDHTVSTSATGAANTAAELANTMAALAAEKAALADEKATEAGNVNATMTGTFINVTDRTGQTTTTNIQGDPGTTDYNQLVHKPDLTVYVTDAVYDAGNHLLKFKNSEGAVIATIDAAPFIKDAVVDSVVVENGYLVITFNTDAGKQPISIALTDIFDPANYYTKTETDTIMKDMADFVEEVPDETGFINEVDRVMLLLYQALNDAGAVITPAQAATALAQAKAQLADQAATDANNAATLANTKAGYAQDQGDYAKAQGQAAQAIVDDAKGDFDSLDERLDYIEENAGTVDFVEDNTDTFPWRQ